MLRQPCQGVAHRWSFEVGKGKLALIVDAPSHLTRPVEARRGRPIIDLARLLCEVAGLDGDFATHSTRPDGTMRKLMSGERLQARGWAPTIGLKAGIEGVYTAFKAANA